MWFNWTGLEPLKSDILMQDLNWGSSPYNNRIRSRMLYIDGCWLLDDVDDYRADNREGSERGGG